jgi:hypothetical protein
MNITDRRMQRGRAISALSLVASYPGPPPQRTWVRGYFFDYLRGKTREKRQSKAQIASVLAVATGFIGLWTVISQGAYMWEKISMQEVQGGLIREGPGGVIVGFYGKCMHPISDYILQLDWELPHYIYPEILLGTKLGSLVPNCLWLAESISTIYLHCLSDLSAKYPG